jgi:hypothetical protein
VRAGYVHAQICQMLYSYTCLPHYTATFTFASTFSALASIVPQHAEIFSFPSSGGASMNLHRPLTYIRRDDEPCRTGSCRVMTPQPSHPKSNITSAALDLPASPAPQLLPRNTFFLS